MRRLTNDDAVPPPERVLAEARRLLAEREGLEHNHTLADGCPVCGGKPPGDPEPTSFHPVQQRIDSNEENV